MATTEIVPFADLTRALAERFEVAPDELIATIKAACFPQGAASNAQLMMLLSFAKNYDLNPLARECYAFVSGGRMSIGVQVDGWSKIANRQQDYDGQDFEYQTDSHGEITAITCKTYVKGRQHPTVYRAVMKEWRRATDVWNQMPTHQLYVKARNQSIRFAFGIPAYDPDDIERIERSANNGAIETTAKTLGDAPTSAAPVEPAPSGSAAPAPNPGVEAGDGVAPSQTNPSPENASAAGAAPIPLAERRKRRAASEMTVVSETLGPEQTESFLGARQHLDTLIARHVTAQRLELMLGKIGATKVETLTDEQVATLTTMIEQRFAK